MATATAEEISLPSASRAWSSAPTLRTGGGSSEFRVSAGAERPRKVAALEPEVDELPPFFCCFALRLAELRASPKVSTSRQAAQIVVLVVGVVVVVVVVGESTLHLCIEACRESGL